MFEVLGITGPIFILIGLGFVAVRSGLIGIEQVRGMGTFVIYFALPALLFNALSQRDFDEVMNVSYLSAYALASLAVFGSGLLLASRLRGQGLSASAVLAMGMAVPNSGFVGYPIAVMVMGNTAALGMALGMLVENLLLLPLALALAEAGQQRGEGWRVARETGLRLLRNPLIIAISLGLASSVSGWHLPALPQRVIDMLVGASAPVALFVIGGSLAAALAAQRPQGMLADVLQTSLGKLVLHPAALALSYLVFTDIDPLLMVTGLLFAAAPVMTVYPILGQRYGLEQRCAAALVANMVLAFFSLNALLALLRWQGLLPS